MLPWLPVFFVPALGYPAVMLAFVVPGKMNVWNANLLAALCIGALYLMSRKTDALDARWGEGARGEFRVGEELEKLHKVGFHVFHDWYSENRGNVDHFVVGPQGVFAVETKAWTGEVTCEGGEILVDGKPPGKDPIRQVKGEAADVSRLVQESRSVKTWVRPILCFTRADLCCRGTVNGVTVTSLGSLKQAILGHGSVLPLQRVNSISYALEKRLGVGPAAKPGLPPKEPSKLEKLLRPERVFVAAYLIYLSVLCVVFAGSTATVFEGAAEFFRSLERV